MRRRMFVCTIVRGLLFLPVAVTAQALATRTFRIGYLSSHSAAAGKVYAQAVRDGLSDLGYVEGRNLVIEYRWADGDYGRLPALARELVRLNVEVIVSAGGPQAARAAKAASSSIPVVFVSGAVVQAGLVSSLARPGGNITGLEVLAEELDIKRLELLKQTLPKATRVVVLWNPATPEGDVQRQRLEAAAGAMGLKLRFYGAGHPDQLERVLAEIAQGRFDALLVSTDPMFSSEAARLVRWAAGARLPTIYFSRSFADGLMIYGPNFAGIYRRSATYVDKILKGAKPGDLPVEQPTKFELVINLRTAKALGLAIPQSLLLRADEVIS
jgi:putative ABC transport system substrate-binding protein